MSELWPDGRAAAVTITFDGGYVASYEHATPLLVDRCLPSSWFLVADAVGRELEGRAVASPEVWTDADPDLIEVGNHSLTHPLVRRGAFQLLGRALESPGAIVRGTHRLVSGRHPAAGSTPPASRPVHREVAAADFAAGKSVLERMIGRRVPAFAYPNGRARRDLVRAVQRMGHDSARTSQPGWNDPTRLTPYALRAQTWTRATLSSEPRAWLDQAIRRRSWLIEVLHVVEDTVSSDFPWTTTTSQLARHLDELAAANVWIASQSSVVEHLRHAAAARTRGQDAR